MRLPLAPTRTIAVIGGPTTATDGRPAGPESGVLSLQAGGAWGCLRGTMEWRGRDLQTGGSKVEVVPR